MSNIIGVRNNSTIVPYSAATKRTKEITTITPVAGTNVSSIASVYSSFYFYADSNNKWRMTGTLNFTANLATGASFVFNIPGVALAASSGAVAFPAIAVIDDATYIAQYDSCYGIATTGNIYINLKASVTGENTKAIYIQINDVPLNAEPTIYTTAANMEGVTAVDVYIAPASASAAGLLSYYEEGSFTVYGLDGGTTVGSGATAYYVRVGKQVTVTLPDTGIQSTSVVRYISTTAAQGSTVGNRTWPANITPARTQYILMKVTTGTGTYAVTYGNLSSSGVFSVIGTVGGGTFGGNNEVKGAMENTITYHLN